MVQPKPLEEAMPPEPEAQFPPSVANAASQTDAAMVRLQAALAERYVFESELGRGGSGVVFRAFDTREQRKVAVKLLRPDVSGMLGTIRFQREIEIVRLLSHRNILALYDFGAIEGMIYFTMPLVEGHTLRARLDRERQLPQAEAVEIARGVAAALDHAHQRGVIHRDIKPANILLSGDTTVVADFGIARALSGGDAPEHAGRITDSGLIVGTPEYMSPEQGTGERDLDARSDVYALACVLYEMLAGEPPFTGPTAQAIIARHCRDDPRPIRTVRPALPLGAERAIQKALAKSPADRYASAGEFIAAVDAAVRNPDTFEERRSISKPVRFLAAAAVLLTAAGLGTWYARFRAPPPNPNKIVVFPLYDPAAPPGDHSGEAVADYVGHALAGTRPLRWVDGWELLGKDARDGGDRLSAGRFRAVARRAGAGFYIDGSILRQPDSATVLLTLVSVPGDSALGAARRTVPASALLAKVGVELVAELLPALIAPGGTVDVRTLTERDPVAIANFLQGEREYRRMEFRTALAHYGAAAETDSLFVHAALRGAQAASWLSDETTGVRFSALAMKRLSAFAPPESLFVRGLNAYLTGGPDTAVTYLRRSLRADSTSPAAWTVLGEVYLRGLPTMPRTDSLAQHALQAARRLDREFAPALLLLEEIALNRGDVRAADRLRDELIAAGAGTTHQSSRQIMLECLRGGPESIDWRSSAKESESSVLGSAIVLGGGAAQPPCARAAFSAVLAADSATPGGRFYAALGVLAQLTASARFRDIESVLESTGFRALSQRSQELLTLLVGSVIDSGAVRQRAAEYARRGADSGYRRLTAPVLWHFALWEFREKNVDRLETIARRANERADSLGSRVDVLVSAAITARLRALTGDSAGAVELLRGLHPSAQRTGILWSAWESLGAERLLLAQLLFARGESVEADRVAALLDANGPVAYPLFLQHSLELRARIAEQDGQGARAAALKRQMSRLRSL